MAPYEITLKEVQKPHIMTPEEELAWLCESFNFQHGRDTERISARLISELLKELAYQPRVSSEELAQHLNVSRACVNHHVRNLTTAGFLAREKKRIILRGGNLSGTIHEIRKDAERILDELAEVATNLDKALGFQ